MDKRTKGIIESDAAASVDRESIGEGQPPPTHPRRVPVQSVHMCD